MYSIEILLVLGLVTFAQGTNSSLLLNWQSSWIIGGTNAALGEFPYLAFLRRGDEGEYCAGSIIRSVYILTAAHCVARIPLPSILARVGNIKGDNPSIKVSQKIIHPHFDQHTYANDIALLKLRKPVGNGLWVQPIPLPKQGEQVPVGKECVLIGWEYVKISGQDPVYPKKLRVNMISNSEGKKYCKGASVTHIFTKSGHGEWATKGDSGGPLVCDGKLIGILSGIARETCDSRHISVYAGVSYYIKWINERTLRRSSI